MHIADSKYSKQGGPSGTAGGPHLPKTWHWWATRALAVAWPMPEETPVTTTTLSMLTMTPRLSLGPSSYWLRSHPDSSQSSCCLAA